MRAYARVLRHRDLRYLFSALVVSACGSWAYNVALAVFVYERTHSPSWVSAVFLAKFVPSLLVSAYGGVVAERFERVRLMASLDLLMSALQVAIAVTAAMHGPVIVAIVLAGLTSVSSTPYLPAVSAMLPQLAGEEDLAAANALNSTIDNLVIIAGPAIGALMLLAGPPSLVFALNAASFAVSALLVSRMRARSAVTDVTEGGEAGLLSQLRVGIATIMHSGNAALLVGFSVLASFLYGTDTVLFIVLSKEQLGTGADGYGYLLAGLGVGGVLTAVLIDRLARMPRLGAVISLGMVVYCVPTAAMVLVHQPGVAFALEVVRGGGTLVVDTLAVIALQRSLAPELVARVFGVFWALVLGAISLGALLVPPVLHAVGLRGALLAFGLVIPALVVLGYPLLMSMDRTAAARFRVIRPRIAVLEGLGLFAHASRAALEKLADAAVEVEAPAGEAIVREGQPADALYVLVDGSVQVSAAGELGGLARPIRTMTGPTYFGEIGLLRQIPRTATVTTSTPCRLYRIDGKAFLDALTTSPASPSMLEGAKTRLVITHPSYRGVPEAPVPAGA